MYGAEYEMFGNTPSSSLPLNQHDVSCAVCYASSRETVLMIPGKYTCPQNRTCEHYGYLMAERYCHYRSTFECVDVAPETITGHVNQNGALFYHVEPVIVAIYFKKSNILCVILKGMPYQLENRYYCSGDSDQF